MISIRERILREVLTRCQTAVAPVTVLRQPTRPVTREQTPVLLIAILADHPVKRSNDRLERELMIQITAHSRDLVDGFAVADELLCAAHQALFADTSLAGIALGIDELESDYQAEDADGDAIAIPASYRITYRTLVADISKGG